MKSKKNIEDRYILTEKGKAMVNTKNNRIEDEVILIQGMLELLEIANKDKKS